VARILAGELAKPWTSRQSPVSACQKEYKNSVDQEKKKKSKLGLSDNW
jgi:hypothetical protein